PVPAGARTARLALRGERPTGAGSARNVNFDALAMMLAPYVPPPPPDRVHGDLLQLDPNGGWCWYQDERAVVDRARGELLVGSIGSYGGLGGQTEDGLVQVSHVDLASRRRTLHTLDDIESYGGGDDHNVPGFVVKQDGDVLACYAAHNQRDGTLDDRSYLRTFDVATASWGAVTEWHWWPVIPANAPGSGGTTYANVFQLAAEDPDHDTHGRLYNFARTQQSPHTMYSDDNGATWIYGGQLTEAPSATPAGNNYVNGYYRYWSNGVDRIDLIATEYHPRDFNTSIYHAYIQGGRMYDSAGNVIDNDIFDAAGSFHSANVPSTDDMTPVFVCDGIQWSRAWNTDVHAFADGTVVALFKARPVPYDPNASVGDGDHRVFYGRLDPTTLTWSTHEVCKAGARLFAGEQDYTGLGAIDPRDPDRIWISTEVHPVQDVLTDHHEIYEGRTADDGASWSWRALTADSTVDNRRPIAPAWDAHHTALLWWRGDHANSIVRDTAVVGLLLADDEERAPLAYVDADSGNTARADGAPWNVTSGSGAGAADGQWHRRTGFGNGGDVFTADESGAEDVPLLRTTVTGLPAGRYDVFACFWTDSADWRIAAGLAADELMVYRRHGAQSALAVDFGDPLLDREGNRTLMRAYLGRVELAAAQPLEVFVDDAGDGSATRTWFDGVALAPVAAQAFGVGCGDPQLALLPEPGARPVFGATARALVTGAPTAIAALALGFSRSALGPTPLPLD
ncbi:MAG: hypothetical protein KDE27_16915, partial [Planctomycetes bacterium]|nr:hypothetical protein [Planctomycetota bacterium]